MRPVLLVGPWILVAVLVITVIAAWARPRPELDADRAAEVAVGALASVGYETEPVGEPRLEPARPDALDSPEVWVVDLAVDGEEIFVQVPTDVGELLYIDDNIGPATAPKQLLTDDEVERLDAYRDDRLADDRRQQNTLGSIAAAVAFLPTALLGRRAGQRLRDDT